MCKDFELSTKKKLKFSAPDMLIEKYKESQSKMNRVEQPYFIMFDLDLHVLRRDQICFLILEHYLSKATIPDSFPNKVVYI
jgi:hypothetical protein